MYGWTNEHLDADYAKWAEMDAYDDFYDNEGDCTPETHGEDCNRQKDGSWVCALCDEPCDGPLLSDLYLMEDQWLDGSYEE